MSKAGSLSSSIEKCNEAFMRAVKEGDATAMAACYTEDAWLLPPGADIIRGRPQIETFWRTRSERIAALTLITLDVVALGDDAAREVCSATATLKGSEGQQVAGKGLAVLRRMDGEWKYESDMFAINA